MAIAFFCTRAPANWSLENRARRIAGTRLLVQAAIALWSALLVLQRGLFALEDIVGLRPAPHLVIAGAMLLMIVGAYWWIRGSRLLKPRRIFV